MKRSNVLFLSGFIGILFILVCFVIASENNPQPAEMQNEKAGVLRADLSFSKIPLYFIPNHGQVNQKATFYAKTSGYILWMTKEGLVFDSFKKSEDRGQKTEKPLQRFNVSTSQRQYQRDVYRMLFISANKNPDIVPVDQARHRVNYFKGNDPSKWVGDIPTSKAVLYKSVYKNINLKVYGIEKQIEYDWIVKPGGNPEEIRFEYKKVKSTHIDKEGNLIIKTKFGNILHKKPRSFQIISDAEKQEVQATFKKIGKNTYGFEVGKYDKDRELIIDPVVLIYSTYLGGGGMETGHGIAVGNQGRVYVTGQTASTDFPILDEYMDDPGDTDTDVFISKIDVTQTGNPCLIYSTYLGGAGAETGYDIVVKGKNIVYITGYTSSTDFPTLNQYQTHQGGIDAFITKIDTSISGTSGLLYSTYLGGNAVDEGRGIALAFGSEITGDIIYVTGSTDSTNFPISSDPWMGTSGGGVDVFVSKIDTDLGASGLLYSTYQGGSSNDYGMDIEVDDLNFAYVVGSTESSNFPTAGSPYQSTHGGGTLDAFAARIWTAPGPGQGAFTLQYSTYLGGSGNDGGEGMVLDEIYNILLTGYTSSTNFPTLNQYQTHQGGIDAFITKINTSAPGTSGFLYSTYLGGSGADSGHGLGIGKSGDVTITGTTASTNFPTLIEYQLDQAADDAFVARIDTTQSGSPGLVYSTYLGGSGNDAGNAIAVDGIDSPHVTGQTDSTDFPTLNEYMMDPGDSNTDAFVSRLLYSVLTVTSPNGGENWKPGTSRNITWDSTGILGVLGIGLYKDGQLEGVISDGVEAAAGFYVWTVGELIAGTALPGSGYTVKIEEVGNTAFDISDMPFSMSALGITSPIGFEVWPLGSSHDITWSAPGMSNNLKITLWKSGVLVGVIANNVDPTSGSYTWNVGDYMGGTAVPGVDYKVKIQEKGTSVIDMSPDLFIISPPPSITVISPNGGESWGLGTPQNISWISSDISSSLKITLWKDGIPLGLITDALEPGATSYSWLAGQHSGGFASAGSGYTIKVKEKGTVAVDTSDGAFELTPGSVTVSSPNGGENWFLNSTQDITWSAQGLNGLLKITLWKDGSLLGGVANDVVAATGLYSWVVGQYYGGTAVEGGGYTIKIKEKFTSISDTSNSTFNITIPPPLTVTSPNGSESWDAGSRQQITWEAPGVTGLLKITLWKGGVKVGNIANNIDPTLGFIDWLAGESDSGVAAAGTDYRIKIKDKNSYINDFSDANFTLTDI